MPRWLLLYTALNVVPLINMWWSHTDVGKTWPVKMKKSYTVMLLASVAFLVYVFPCWLVSTVMIEWPCLTLVLWLKVHEGIWTGEVLEFQCHWLLMEQVLCILLKVAFVVLHVRTVGNVYSWAAVQRLTMMSVLRRFLQWTLMRVSGSLTQLLSASSFTLTHFCHSSRRM